MEDKVKKQQEFIELRAKGNSFDRIAKRISVSKGTLIDWSKQLSVDLRNRISLETDTTIEKYQLARKNQLELYGVQLAKIREELGKRDLKEVSTPKLIEMQMKLIDAINNDDKTTITFSSKGLEWDDESYNWQVG